MKIWSNLVISVLLEGSAIAITGSRGDGVGAEVAAWDAAPARAPPDEGSGATDGTG